MRESYYIFVVISESDALVFFVSRRASLDNRIVLGAIGQISRWFFGILESKKGATWITVNGFCIVMCFFDGLQILYGSFLNSVIK